MSGTSAPGTGAAISVFPAPLPGTLFHGSGGNLEYSSAVGCWEAVRLGPGGQYVQEEDFPLPAGSALPGPWSTQTTAAAGTPTLDYVDNAVGGQYALQLTTDHAVQAVTLYQGDQLTFDPQKKLRIDFRIKLEPDPTGGSGALAAGDAVLIGFASARDSNPDAIAESAWFLLKGGTSDIMWESDDGTTDNDDQSPDIAATWSDGGWLRLRIEAHDPSAVQFIVTGVGVIGTADWSNASGPVQPFIELRKASASNNDHRLTVDYVGVCQWER